MRTKFFHTACFFLYIGILSYGQEKREIDSQEKILDSLNKNVKKPILTTDGKQFLLNQSWEGNIRELENCIQRTVVLAQGQPISSALLSMQPGQTYQSLKQAKVNLLPSANNEESEEIVTLDEIEKRAIENALKVKKGNIMQIAKALGVSRTTLYSKIQKYNILIE